MTTVERPSRASVIGLGKMGSAVAEALVNADREVTVWNRTASKCDEMRQKGVSPAASVAEAASAADVTIVCLSDHAATKEIVFNDEVGQALNDKLLVQLSTISADQSRETAAWAEAQGITYLEGSILGLSSDVTGGSAIIVYAGPREAFDDNREMLFALGGSPKYFSEEIGAAVTFDKVYLTFAYGIVQAFLQGAAMAHATGVPIEAYTDTVAARLPVFVRKFKRFGDMIAKRNYDDVRCSMAVHSPILAGCLAMCREVGVDDTLPVALMHNLERALAAGHGPREISALFEVLAGDGSRDSNVSC